MWIIKLLGRNTNYKDCRLHHEEEERVSNDGIIGDLPTIKFTYISSRYSPCIPPLLHRMLSSVLYSLHILVSTRVRTGGVRENIIHSSTRRTLGIPKMCIGTLDFLRVKVGRCNLGFPCTFSKSQRYIETCYLFGFLWSHHILPWRGLKHAVYRRRLRLYQGPDRLRVVSSRVNFQILI